MISESFSCPSLNLSWYFMCMYTAVFFPMYLTSISLPSRTSDDNLPFALFFSWEETVCRKGNHLRSGLLYSRELWRNIPLWSVITVILSTIFLQKEKLKCFCLFVFVYLLFPLLSPVAIAVMVGRKGSWCDVSAAEGIFLNPACCLLKYTFDA